MDVLLFTLAPATVIATGQAAIWLCFPQSPLRYRQTRDHSRGAAKRPTRRLWIRRYPMLSDVFELKSLCTWFVVTLFLLLYFWPRMN